MIERGELTAEKLVRSCLERISRRDAEVKAWVCLHPDAMAQANAAQGPLRGVPVGVKDIFDTHDLPTEYGSRVYTGYRPRTDSAPVAVTRRAGGTILGKTVTAEFATFVPGATRNPHDLKRTPGGSSSGSAAAVADFMVPLAFGTQTAGSVIRPASYCGVVACKPTYNLLPRAGVKPGADSLDTVGVYGRSVEDVAFFLSALTGLDLAREPLKPRVGVYRGAAEPAMESMLDTAARALNARDVAFPAHAKLAQAHRAILWYEIARSLADEVTRFPAQMDAALRQRCLDGFALDPEEYLDARRVALAARKSLEDLFGGNDVLIAPAATGEAPLGMPTGDIAMNAVWTLLHVPCVAVPAAVGPHGMPLGIQVIGRIGDDARTLACADWIHSHLKEG